MPRSGGRDQKKFRKQGGEGRGEGITTISPPPQLRSSGSQVECGRGGPMERVTLAEAAPQEGTQEVEETPQDWGGKC